MATLELNNGIANIPAGSGLEELYGKLYQIMHDANQIELPDYAATPPLTPDGKIDQNAVKQRIQADSDIMMHNAAYEWANAIISTVNGGGGGSSGGSGFLSRAGDSMAGALGALYGFQGGHDNEMILELIHDAVLASDKFNGRTAHVDGHLKVDGDATVGGQLNLGNSGIYFANHQSVFYSDNKLHIDSQDIKITGGVVVDGSFKLGDIVINSNGLFNGTKEYYHSGNCNNAATDWSTKDAHVYGNLTVDGAQTLGGRLIALQGFSLGEAAQVMLYSVDPANPWSHTTAPIKNTCYLQLEADLNLWTGYAVKFESKTVLKVKSGSTSTVSLCAPGMVLNLGDSDSGEATKAIHLQADIKHFNGDYTIVSYDGSGQFRNGLSAWTANAGTEVLSTYSVSTTDIGVLFKKNIRLGQVDGPALASLSKDTVCFTLPYPHAGVGNTTIWEPLPFRFYFADTDSLFKSSTNAWSASLNFDLGDDAEFFVFRKPIEATFFSVISSRYKTRLGENALFFHDGIFMEGIFGDSGPDGIRFSGNSYFDNNAGSIRFSGGFDGYGWGVINNRGSYTATFDDLVIRKRLRVYELEVQKQSVTNGSWWVTDSCSGDIVEKIS